VHLDGFIIKKNVTVHGHMSRCMVMCHDARSHERKIGHALLKTLVLKFTESTKTK